MFETEEKFRKPTAYMQKRGVEKMGISDAVKIEETADAVKICSTSNVKYYYKDRVEEAATPWFCATISKDLLPDIKRRLEKVKI